MSSSAVLLLAPFPGKTISVPYLGYEAVDLLVQRALFKMEADEIRVDTLTVRTYFNGVAIEDWSRTIDDCKIYGNVITLKFDCVRADEEIGTFPIQIRTLTGKVIPLMITSSVRVGELKKMIEDREGIPPDQQRLIYAGKQLEGPNRRFGMFNIQKGANIHLVLRLRGGGGAEFADLEKASVKKLAFSENAHPGRTACKGMNIEAKCQCTPAYRVICQQRFGLYELGRSALQCPLCNNKQVDPVTVGFYDCEYRAHGFKDDGSQFSTDWIKVDDGRYSLYDPTEQTTWKRLAIETRPLSTTYSQDVCVICLSSLEESYSRGKLETLACKHQFHKACIDSWHGSCPICRASRL